MRRLPVWVAVAATALCIVGSTAWADDLSASERAELLQRKETLFQQTLRDPGNLDTAFAYADTSAKLGDNEAAVSALERMLLFNPNLPRVQLELGALYFRMGSYEISRTYFDKALQANPPEEVKARISNYLAQIDKMNGPSQLSGFLFFGSQYQSDANLGPGSPLISSPIGTVLLNNQFVKKADDNFFATGSALYSYDLGTQNRDTFELLGTGFVNQYLSVRRLDLAVTEAAAGPRFNFPDLAPWISTASLKPYGIANYVSLGGNPYFHTEGLGGEATATVGDNYLLKSVFEYRAKNFSSAPDRPLSHDTLTGSDKLMSLFLSKQVTSDPESFLNLEFDFLDQDTKAAYYTNKSYAGALAYRIRYADPLGWLKYPLETTVFGSISSSNYAGPDPCCVPATTRADTHWRFGLSHAVQVTNSISIVAQFQRDIISSNIPLYAYTSNSVLVGPQFRF